MSVWNKTKIQSIVRVFETGKTQGDYGNVSIFADGPNGVRQITYGALQTTQSSHLKELINNYIKEDGLFAKDFLPYAKRVDDFKLVNDINFVSLLKKAGSDPKMQKVQEELFDEKYWQPAVEWAEEHKFTEQLSMLVIFDSFIHSGGILSFLRKRFKELTPLNRGNEKEWVEDYVNTRHNWLANHRIPILRKTIYRTTAFKEAINKKDWDLKLEFNANGVKIK